PPLVERWPGAGGHLGARPPPPARDERGTGQHRPKVRGASNTGAPGGLGTWRGPCPHPMPPQSHRGGGVRRAVSPSAPRKRRRATAPLGAPGESGPAVKSAGQGAPRVCCTRSWEPPTSARERTPGGVLVGASTPPRSRECGRHFPSDIYKKKKRVTTLIAYVKVKVIGTASPILNYRIS
ncbi:hypothetical protein ALC60_09422, partial [Trachymyrmex zeteki]